MPWTRLSQASMRKWQLTTEVVEASVVAYRFDGASPLRSCSALVAGNSGRCIRSGFFRPHRRAGAGGATAIETSVDCSGTALRPQRPAGKIRIARCYPQLQRTAVLDSGVNAEVKGAYGVTSSNKDFVGGVKLEAHVSGTMTGAKRVSLKPGGSAVRQGPYRNVSADQC